MNRLPFACVIVLCLAGCPKNVPENVAGTDDEQMDRYSAQLEEQRTRSAQDMKCDDWCNEKPNVCRISKAVCDISARKGDRADFQSKCVAAQEDCAKYSDNCSGCRK
jgi:hypothetical protein